MKQLSILILNLLFLIPGLKAQEDTTMLLSLEQSLEYALEHNINVLNAKLDVEKSDRTVWETTAIGLPQVNASGSYINNLSLATQLFPNFIEPTIVGVLVEQGILAPSALDSIGDPDLIEVQFGTKHNFTGTISVSQLIFSGEYIVGLQASKVYRSLSQQSLDKTEIETKGAIEGLYYLMLLSENNIKTVSANLENMEQTLYETKQMFKSGLMDQTSVDQIQISVKSLENTLNSLKRQKESLYNMFRIQLGLDLDQPIQLTEDLDEILAAIDLDNILNKEFEMANNIDYQMMETQVHLQELNLKREKSKYLPTLSAFYNYNQNAMRDEFSLFDTDEKWYESSMLGVNLDVPIFSSGMRRARVQQAQIELEKKSNLMNLTQKSLNNSILEARNNLLTAKENLSNTEANKNLAKRVLKQTTIKHNTGMVSSLELTQANSQYLQTESQYLAAIVDLLNAKIELEKILNEL